MIARLLPTAPFVPLLLFRLCLALALCAPAASPVVAGCTDCGAPCEQTCCSDCYRRRCTPPPPVCRPKCEAPAPESAPAAPESAPASGAYAGPPRTGTALGAANTLGIIGPEITLPELRLRLPTIQLPTVFRSHRGPRMRLDEAEAAYVPHFQQQFVTQAPESSALRFGGPNESAPVRPERPRDESAPAAPESAPTSCTAAEFDRLRRRERELEDKIGRLEQAIERLAGDPHRGGRPSCTTSAPPSYGGHPAPGCTTPAYPAPGYPSADARRPTPPAGDPYDTEPLPAARSAGGRAFEEAAFRPTVWNEAVAPAPGEWIQRTAYLEARLQELEQRIAEQPRVDVPTLLPAPGPSPTPRPTLRIERLPPAPR